MSSFSPRPPGGGSLRPPPPRGDSSSASPHISPTSTAPWSFPQSVPSAVPPPPPTAPTASTSRFNAAFANYPSASSSSRHTNHTSVSSITSDSSPHHLARANGELDDDASPMEERAFGAFQRGIAGAPLPPPGQNGKGLGLMEDTRERGLGPNFPREMGKLYEEPEEYESSRAGQGHGREGEAGTRANGTSSRSGMNGGAAAGEEEVDAMAFLLSPPPTFDPTTASAKQFAAAAATDAPKQKDRSGRDRVFPAPLYLGGRNHSISAASGTNGSPVLPASPVFAPVAPLSIPRRPSTTASSISTSSAVSSPSIAFARSWGPREREGPMGPPPPDAGRTHLAYHRRQQSSTSSLSHGGSYLPYNNSYSYEPRHQATLSTSTSSTTSPSVGSSRTTSTFPTPSNPSVPLPPTSSASTHGSAHGSTSSSVPISSEPPITSQALLLHVLGLRSASSPMALSQSQGPPSRSNTPLYAQAANHNRIRSASSTHSAEAEGTGGGAATRRNGASDGGGESLAVRDGNGNGSGSSALRPSGATSPYHGGNGGGGGPKLDTVDLSHKRIADVPVEVVEELKDEVEKLALGYNLLKDLPMSFTMLGSRLKYLNVRVNMMTTFPAVLCEMPSIEILDISRNKIRKLPQNPGTLLNLKVFSIAKNRIKRLPVWFTTMSHLKVLKLDHNPLEWPPREVTTFTASISTSGQPMSKQEEADEMQRWLPALMRWMKENREREVERERGREMEKRRRPSLAIEQISEDEGPRGEERRPVGMIRTESGRLNDSLSRTRPIAMPPPLPPSTAAVEVDAAREDEHSPLDPSIRHSRNASHTTAQALVATPRPGLRAKKSLPDLRQSHADILAERRTGTPLEDDSQPVVPSLDVEPLRRLQDSDRPVLTHSSSAGRITTIASAPASAAPTPAPLAGDIVRAQSARPTGKASPPSGVGIATRHGTAPLPVIQPLRPKPALDAQGKGKRGENAATGDFDRNSGAYFRRLSMLPVSTIAKTVPVPLLQFADAIRGILFSLSQIYSALRQFVVFASQDRLPMPVARLMGSADTSMSALINALDRFDSLSRRGTPSTDIVRDIFTSCRSTVGVFSKLVAALQPHLKALTATADARYTRTLLLMLYGSMGEIANSWGAVAPLLAEAEDPILTHLVVQPPTPSPQLEQKSSSSSPHDGGANLGSSTSSQPRLTRQRSTTRRHAGSFSVEDVQMGAVLPPADIPPVPALPFSMEDGGLSASSSLSFSNVNGANDFAAAAAAAALASSASSSTSAATLRARPALSAKSSSGSSFASSPSYSSNRAPPPGALSLPPQLGYEEMAQKAFEHPLTPGVQGLMDRAGGATGMGSQEPMPQSRSASRQGSFSNASGGGGGAGGMSGMTGLSASVSSSFAAGNSNSTPPSMPPPSFAYAGPPQAIYRPHRESRPVSTLNADETFIDQAESTMAIASDVYGMLLDSFDDPRVADQFLTISGGRRKLKELGELCKAGNEVTSRLGRAVERVRGSDGRGRLRFLQTDATELGTAAFEYVQNVIRTAKLMKAVSQELAFPQRLKDAVGQLTLGTREFARLLSHGHTSFRPTPAYSSSQTPSGGNGGLAPVPEGGGGGGGGLRGRRGTVTELPEVRARDFAG